MNSQIFDVSRRRNLLVAGFTVGALFFHSTLASADVPSSASGLETRPEHSGFAQLSKSLQPSVVSIEVEKVVSPKAGALDFFGDRFDERGSKKPHFLPRETGQGSGFIISRDGYILTNHHVVSDARTVKVTLSDGRELQAKVIGSDPKTDVALVKVEGGNNLPCAILGDSDRVDVGDWVMAIGNPYGLDATVTVGVLSGKGRVIGAGPYDDYLQTDASINPGNSGGPLFDSQGRVVGINTAIISGGQGIGFAVPINLAKEIEQQLITSGHVVRGFLGLGVQPLSPKLREALQLPSNTQGALVAQVVPKGPAGSAGIQVEDVVTSINGKPIHSDRDLVSQAARLPVHEVAQVGVLRHGREVTFPVAIIEHPDDTKEAHVAPVGSLKPMNSLQESLGIDVVPLSADVASELGTKDLHGVVVADVATNSAAQRAGLERGDIIRMVNDRKVKGLDEFVTTVKTEERGPGLAFLVERGGRTHFVSIDS